MENLQTKGISKEKLLPNLLLPTLCAGMCGLCVVAAPLVIIPSVFTWAFGGISVLLFSHSISERLGTTKLEKFFKSINFQVDGKFPEIINYEKNETSEIYTIKLQAGMCSDMFIKMKQPIEQYLDKTVTIVYKHNLIITAYHQDIQTKYDYELVQTDKPLKILIGYGLNGKVFFDLEEAPHLLVASTTGGGKTVFMNCSITSYIMLKEDVVDLHLVDMAAVEFKMFRNVGSVKSFVTDDVEFDKLMKILKKEADKRRNLFYEKDVGCLSDYNKHQKKDRLKHIVVCIDEYASLVAFPKLLAELYLRLANDRKFGIHYIIATQYPSVEMTKGVLKANLPQRIAFLTASDSDSRIILGKNGAEELRGKGHGLLKAGGGELVEFQGLMLEDEDCEAMIACKNVKKKDEVNKCATEKKLLPNAKRSPHTPLY